MYAFGLTLTSNNSVTKIGIDEFLNPDVALDLIGYVYGKLVLPDLPTQTMVKLRKTFNLNTGE